jgi:hypothetical protein
VPVDLPRVVDERDDEPDRDVLAGIADSLAPIPSSLMPDDVQPACSSGVWLVISWGASPQPS